jgi:hypothetical protein
LLTSSHAFINHKVFFFYWKTNIQKPELVPPLTHSKRFTKQPSIFLLDLFH